MISGHECVNKVSSSFAVLSFLLLSDFFSCYLGADKGSSKHVWCKLRDVILRK